MLLGLVLTRFLREPLRGTADGGEQNASTSHISHPMRLSEVLHSVWAAPTAVLLMAAFIGANFVAVVLLSWMPKFLFDRFHMSLAVAGLTATLFAQLASMVGSLSGGWIADFLRSRTPRGRILVQAFGLLCGAPFVALCGLTHSVLVLVLALTAWGLFTARTMRTFLRRCLCSPARGSRDGGGIHEHGGMARRRGISPSRRRLDRDALRPRYGDRGHVRRLRCGRRRALCGSVRFCAPHIARMQSSLRQAVPLV